MSLRFQLRKEGRHVEDILLQLERKVEVVGAVVLGDLQHLGRGNAGSVVSAHFIDDALEFLQLLKYFELVDLAFLCELIDVFFGDICLLFGFC